jgi:hypothetical protein
MNFIARNFCRKWLCCGSIAVSGILVVATLGGSLVRVAPAQAAAEQSPRPEQPGRALRTKRIPSPRPATKSTPAAKKPSAVKPAEQAPAERQAPKGQASEGQASERQASACRLALTEEIAIAPSIPDIHGPGGCGGEDLVRLEAIVLQDKRKVTVKPAAILRCGMASAIANWVRFDMAPLASRLGSTISQLDNFDSYECRGRNRVKGANLSEHGRANAIDVRGFVLANGRSIGLTDRRVPRDSRELALHSACTRFTTVLGPGSDGYHEDHIHLDIMQRRNGYRICHWEVWDALPQTAPALPAERPEQAPPREVGAESQSNDDTAQETTAEPNAAQADNATAGGGGAASSPKPSKKRR